MLGDYLRSTTVENPNERGPNRLYDDWRFGDSRWICDPKFWSSVLQDNPRNTQLLFGVAGGLHAIRLPSIYLILGKGRPPPPHHHPRFHKRPTPHVPPRRYPHRLTRRDQSGFH
jgi:hypothetical protein